jgi:hypothetical protein
MFSLRTSVPLANYLSVTSAKFCQSLGNNFTTNNVTIGFLLARRILLDILSRYVRHLDLM